MVKVLFLQLGNNGFSRLLEASVASGAPAPDEVFLDIATPEGDQDQASMSAERLMEISLSYYPDIATDDSDIEDGVSQRRFSRL